MVSLEIDKTWTLFLDRDGVINHKRENDYVKNWNEFSFINGSLEAISFLSKVFGKIIIVTNQRGVGKGIMKEEDLILIHQRMSDQIELNFGKIDKIYFCTDVSETSLNRKPNLGMGLQALSDFPEINFEKSIMIGDSHSDILFGQKLGMTCFQIENIQNSSKLETPYIKSLSEFAISLKFNQPNIQF
jgi:histidinol-phosphate phosphatase family protein